ncbi:GH3 auxin-responsive promoter family protein [Flavobacterium psychrophilum]|uniref:GH3 auxin-responsive promoter family protein n=1 Tax=Flavobacterium psychrophilum TaxID=96345 RepID=A0A7U2RA55_FLAPS|nr:GH3 auxin-responsive promoter family protein [Flavobacterium psychrophilum]AIN73301.1 CF4-like protein [Flavobacterium psychrophilum FPG3]EKT2069650.1 GH3 auxin-responsive promoter family protein [Flavobacterium psychrophilum]EKT2071910.1 GH3 auxin-responsive promoter family protein [Flavobacterium psychrophilum]EKT3962945.1 GH3 auxin-responsive promoter family protein [Flavobacterium psychrophilum]EKT3966215.1 GH3 auxin-responsive promoter family protein [Flavobacterium psychrophilum]
MSLPIINSIASWFLKQRIHQIELFLKYPNEVQEELLINLIRSSENTIIGKQYGFDSIKSYHTFQERVPVSTYEDLEPLIERTRKGEQQVFWQEPIKWFAKSSGTTNAKSKFIPVSNSALEDCHYKGSKDLLCLYLNNNENSQLFTGKSLRLGGSKQLYEDNNTFFGDLSAILIDNMPFWAEFSSTPSNKTSLMSDWETKLLAIVNETKIENVTSFAGVPSWMMVLLNKVLEETGKNNLFDVWANLEVYFHGGVSFDPYRDQYKKILPKQDFKYYEIYNASEGFFAIQDLNNSNDLLLMLDYGIFYEFISMDIFGTPNEKIIRLAEVEINKNYAIVITTNSGLWRYLIGDTVRFTSLNPYRIRITGRTKHHINVFGEELMVENTDMAIAKTCKMTNSEVKDYTVAPIFMEGKAKGSHEWIIEFRKQPDNIAFFTKILDENIQALNSDYEAKRYNNMTLNQLTVNIARENLFYDWLKKHDKLGGQHKIPRLSNKRDYLEELLLL